MVQLRDNSRKYCVKLHNTIEMQARSESIISVQGRKTLSLITADFDPFILIGIPGV